MQNKIGFYYHAHQNKDYKNNNTIIRKRHIINFTKVKWKSASIVQPPEYKKTSNDKMINYRQMSQLNDVIKGNDHEAVKQSLQGSRSINQEEFKVTTWEIKWSLNNLP